ncbi:MAG: molybdenum ABC transporter ATP-binding protein [Dehalococcoidia bacterium]
MSSRGWAELPLGGFYLSVRWEVEAGEVLALFGPSGAGKSLVLAMIAGLVRPQRGQVEVDGEAVLDTERGIWVPPHLRRVGYVPQHYGLFPHLSVEGNVAFGLARWPREQAEQRVTQLLHAFELEALSRRRPQSLSGGEQQRVALARAMAPGPRLLLLDEPFSALDAELRRRLRRELRARLQGWQLPVVLVAHDQEDVLALAHRVVVLDGGRVVAEGVPLEVLGRPSAPTVARLVGVENVLEAEVVEHHPVEGTMTCRVGETCLEVPSAAVRPGERVLLGLRATDVLVAVQRPQGISARNVLPGSVQDLVAVGHDLEVVIDCGGVTLRARLTPGAVTELGLAPGSSAWAILKATAFSIVEPELPEARD